MDNRFPDTRWTLIQKARSSEESGAALEEWCRSYWPPVHAYICSRGYDPENAREMAQAFFERLFTRGVGESLPDQLNGAFRAFLMRAVKNFLIDQWRAKQSQRKGGGQVREATDRLEEVGDGAPTPEKAFDRKWALTVMTLAMAKLQEEMTDRGHGKFFEMTRHLMDGRSVDQEGRAEMARSLGLTDGAFRVALHRMRGRFRVLIEEEVRQTVSDEEEFQEELRYLFEVWS
jgi:RNA polymerase sigma-70 factor (ECF subfamily)